MPVSNEPLLIEFQDNTLKLIINRPEKRNALSLDLLDRIGETLLDHANRKSLKCAIITAAGDKAFAAGGDLKELDAIRSNAEAETLSQRGRTALDRIRAFPLPVIAGLNGLALGGGAELAMACDLRVASSNAEIGFLQAQLNVTTAWGGGIDLINTIGTSQAMGLLLSARRVSATEALELGIVDYLCNESEDLNEGLAAFIKPYLQRSTEVLRGFKALVATERLSVHERLSDVEQRHFVSAWTSDDHWTAVEKASATRASQKK
jgi:enoyl-CoA hydratase